MVGFSFVFQQSGGSLETLESLNSLEQGGSGTEPEPSEPEPSEPEPSEPFFPKPKAEPEPPEPFSRNPKPEPEPSFPVELCWNSQKKKKKTFLQRNRRSRKPEPLEPFHPQTVTEPNRTEASLLESLENGLFVKRPLFQKDPFFRSRLN